MGAPNSTPHKPKWYIIVGVELRLETTTFIFPELIYWETDNTTTKNRNSIQNATSGHKIHFSLLGIIRHKRQHGGLPIMKLGPWPKN
jgi:hypothetical protein